MNVLILGVSNMSEFFFKHLILKWMHTYGLSVSLSLGIMNLVKLCIEMFNYHVHEFQINVFVNDVQNKQKDFVVKSFYYSSFSKTNGILDSWQNIICGLKVELNVGFGLKFSYIFHHHIWKFLSQKFTS
jgi:hypothetical protein